MNFENLMMLCLPGIWFFYRPRVKTRGYSSFAFQAKIVFVKFLLSRISFLLHFFSQCVFVKNILVQNNFLIDFSIIGTRSVQHGKPRVLTRGKSLYNVPGRHNFLGRFR